MARRTFTDPKEYRALDGFKDDNPVNLENYLGIAGDYEHGEHEEKCCYQKENGNLCQRAHNFGYVVQLKNKSLSLIGNNCATNQFDAGSQIRIDISILKGKRDLEDAQDTLAELLLQEEEIMGAVDRSLATAVTSKTKLDEFGSRIGHGLLSNLQVMSRTQSNAVSITGLAVKKYTVEEGPEKKPVEKEEITEVPITVGRLRGVSAFGLCHTFSPQKSKRELKKSFDDARAVGPNTKLKELQDIAARIRNHADIETQAAKLIEETTLFFSSDVWLLAFMTDDSRHRYEPIRVYLELNGEPHSKVKAKEWLDNAMNEVKKSNRVQRIRLLS